MRIGIGIGFAFLLLGLLLFSIGRQSRTVQAQDVNATSDRHLFLPIISTGAAPIKTKSGIHLGNRGSSDWHAELFTLITGTVTGTWPAAVVVRSDQLFTLQRETTGLCRVTEAILKLTGEGEPYNAFKYLDAAIAAGTKVIIRIAPSPGNFVDYEAPGDNHRLRADETPAGGNYCDETATGGRSQQAKLDAFRDIRDIAEEMSEIYTLTVDSHDWPAELLYFEPANEPNMEWYWKLYKEDRITNLAPNANRKQAWIEMDEYFATLYDRAKQLNSALQILAPPMAQKLYGEHFGLGTCNTWKVEDGGPHSGLDFMKKTYGFDFDMINPNPVPKADGFSLHNYWKAGQEAWETNGNVSLDFHCDYAGGGIANFHIPSDHISQYLPDGIAVTMRGSGKPIFITEADLESPCQDPLDSSSITSKDGFPYSSRDSLLTFTNQEYGARYVIVWLLVNQYQSLTACDTNDEINWHEAYLENGNPRLWFSLWWPVAP